MNHSSGKSINFIIQLIDENGDELIYDQNIKYNELTQDEIKKIQI